MSALTMPYIELLVKLLLVREQARNFHAFILSKNRYSTLNLHDSVCNSSGDKKI